MANRDFKNIQHLLRNIKIISGVVQINASAAVTGIVGRGFSAAKSATGLYLVTLEDKYNALVGGQVTMFKAAAAALFAELSAADVSSAGTVTIRTINGSGVATDTAAAIELHFWLPLRNTDLDR